MSPISLLIKPSSGMCNMECDYCFYCDESKKRQQASYGFMSEQTLKNVIRKTLLPADSDVYYVFQGGEPTLCGLDFFEKVIAYEKKYNRHGVRISHALQTNGYLLDEKWCQFFKEHHFLIGLSVDGTPEIHNTYRHTKGGAPTFDRIAEAAGLLDRYGVDYNILTVVTNRVASHIEEIYHFYRQKNWNYQQYIACLDPLEEERGQSTYSLKPEQYGEFLITLFELWYEDWKQGRQPYIRQFENYVGILKGYQPEACEQRGICSLQNVVEADGSVYPCDFYVLDEYRLGNLNENRMEEILQNWKDSGFREESEKLKEECRECSYFKLCRGGCRRNRVFDAASGQYENYFCKSYRMFFDACVGKLHTMG